MTRATASEQYRPCVGIMLINADGLVFTGRRIDMPAAAWQMPQGGIKKREAPRDAAIRELVEEIGTDKAEILAESRQWLTYDLPEQLRGRVWRGRYIGQRQKWFLARFTGTDTDIRIDTEKPEFADWRWMPLSDLADQIVDFKREVYRAVVDEFQTLLADLAEGT